MPRPLRNPHGLIDRFAMALSALCVLHCVATLALMASFAALGELFANPLIHEGGLILAIVLAALALGSGFRVHRRPLPLIAGLVGLMLMTGGLFVAHGVQEMALTVIGVLIVGAAHWHNIHAVR